MTIKEQFINFLKIILAPYPEYEIVTDRTVDHCKYYHDTSPDGHIMMCQRCERKDEGLCTGCTTHKADVGIENPNEDYYMYYLISGRPDKNTKSFMCCINSYEKMFRCLEWIKYNVESMDRDELAYYKRIEALKEYAHQFYIEFIETYLLKLSKDILPITFKREYKETIKAQWKTITMGDVVYCSKQNQINIYGCEYEDFEHLQRCIRHEIIHYCLNMAGYNSKDNAAVFHVLCELHDAGAYKNMPKKQRELYNKYYDILGTLDEIGRIDRRYSILEKSPELKEAVQIMRDNKSVIVLGLGDRKQNGKRKTIFQNCYDNSCIISEIIDMMRGTITEKTSTNHDTTQGNGDVA